jgi:hypothetical protein
MTKIKLDNDLREKIIHGYLEGTLTLTGYEGNLTAVAVSEPTKEFMPTQTVMRLLRAKHITLLNGVTL